MTLATPDAVFQKHGITAVCKEVFIIICFKKGSMTLGEMLCYMLARKTNVGEYSHAHVIMCDYKIMRVGSIVMHWKSCDRKAANPYWFVSPEGNHQLFPQVKIAELLRAGSNINRKLVFPGKGGYAMNVVTMFMGYKNSFYLFDVQAKSLQAFLSFPAGDTPIYQDGLIIVTDVITISVTA